MTCYLIFNFRPTFFSYFWKITADSVFHNVKKQVGQKWPFPVVKGLKFQYFQQYWCYESRFGRTKQSFKTRYEL